MVDPTITPDKVTASEILEAKKLHGGDAYLWLHTSGDCILWPDEESSVNDDGMEAVERWQTSQQVYDELVESGEVDEQA